MIPFGTTSPLARAHDNRPAAWRTLLVVAAWLSLHPTTLGTGQAAETPARERAPWVELAGPRLQPFQGTGLCQFWTEDYALTSKTEGAVNRVVEEALRKHETVFGFTARADFRVRIRIFGRFTDFERYTRTNQFARQLIQSSQNLSNLGGYYSHGLRHIGGWGAGPVRLGGAGSGPERRRADDGGHDRAAAVGGAWHRPDRSARALPG